MVGMGSVVSKSVPDFALVVGTPARLQGYVCRCGRPFLRLHDQYTPAPADFHCEVCGCFYHLKDEVVSESIGNGSHSLTGR
jgi:UDP-2-acetamido-3-amino-2,3-dideoxy-glucuronate N-acetyltransferase